MAIEEALILY